MTSIRINHFLGSSDGDFFRRLSIVEAAEILLSRRWQGAVRVWNERTDSQICTFDGRYSAGGDEWRAANTPTARLLLAEIYRQCNRKTETEETK